MKADTSLFDKDGQDEFINGLTVIDKALDKAIISLSPQDYCISCNQLELLCVCGDGLGE